MNAVHGKGPSNRRWPTANLSGADDSPRGNHAWPPCGYSERMLLSPCIVVLGVMAYVALGPFVSAVCRRWRKAKDEADAWSRWIECGDGPSGIMISTNNVLM